MSALIEKIAKYKWIFISSMILSACASVSAVNNPTQSAQGPGGSEETPQEVVQPSSSPGATQPSEEPRSEGATGIPTATPTFPPDESPPSGALSQFSTDFSKHSVPYDEILSGGPPKDGIPAIDNPKFVSVEEADQWLEPQEPVILFEVDDDARAYPLQILTWHEIVNDELGGVPVAVTFCPLCNSALSFDRRLDGQVLEFGTSGLLRHSDLVMYDRTTESLWQQFTGEAIIGDLAGKQLTFLPSAIVSYDDFRETHPDGRVLSRETGYSRPYGENPYAGYDTIGQNPFLFQGETDDRLPAMARVVTVSLGEEDVAYPYSVLEEKRVINDNVGGQDLVVFFTPGTNSALGAPIIAEAADVGATNVFDPHVDGEKLTFAIAGETITDEQTGSEWNLLGEAVAGELVGKELMPIVHGDQFWFSWAAFKPDTIIYQGE